MEKVTSVNGFINSLPRIVRKKVWKVIDQYDHTIQCVSATDNRKATAEKYIESKYPGMIFTLVFSHYGDLITIPR